MANVKISDLTALAAQPADDDLFAIVDVSEAADADKTKKITFAYAVKTYADATLTTIQASYPEVVYSARVYNDAAISIPNTTSTALTFNSERWDTDTIHSTSTNTGRLTATHAGIYHIYGNIEFAANATGVRSATIRLNGTTIICAAAVEELGADTPRLVLATEYSLAATDYVELTAYQSSGGALNVAASANYSPEFGMTYLGKAST